MVEIGYSTGHVNNGHVNNGQNLLNNRLLERNFDHKKWDTHYWNGFCWIPYHTNDNDNHFNGEQQEYISDRDYQDEVNADGPAPDGIEEYKNDRGNTMVWVSYLHCYIKRGDEWADEYSFGKHTFTREELRKLMIAAEKTGQAKHQGAKNGSKR